MAAKVLVPRRRREQTVITRQSTRVAAPPPRHSIGLGVVVLVIVCGLITLLFIRGLKPSSSAAANAPRTATWYVAVPHPPTPEQRREADYLSRQHNLRQVQEPGTTRVEIRRVQ